MLLPSLILRNYDGGRAGNPMPLSNADKQRAYRRRKTEVTLGNVTEIQQLQEDVAWLRYQVTDLRYHIDKLSRARDSETLLEDSESKKKKKEALAIARVARAKTIPLADWQPSGRHRDLAYEEGRDDAWLDREAERYRDQQVNAKLKHRDREAGFRNWIRNAPAFEGKPNGHANGQRQKSPVEKLYEGAFRAVAAREERRRARDALVDPLLDGRRSPSDPTGAN